MRFAARLLLTLVTAGTLSAAAQPDVTIRIIPNTNTARWTAIYRLDKPADRLDFARNGQYKRLPKWRVETKGYELVHDDKGDAIVRAPGAKALKTIAVSFPVDLAMVMKDYQLFDPFSDGSLAMYTGHFNLAGTKTTFELTPRRGEHLVAGGKLATRRTTWIDSDGEGTYVYYGTIKPVATPFMIGIVDPGAPQSLVDKLHSALPQLFADYAKLTGVALTQRPTVLFAYTRVTDRGMQMTKGGTLTGLIQLHVDAYPDPAENQRLLERFMKFIAHESAHLWNAQMFTPDQKNDSWMHEGGADAFAWRAVRRAGVIDDATYTARLTSDLNDCLSSLGTRALDGAERAGDFKPVYPCGATLNWLTEAAANGDLHAFWKALFALAKTHEGHYDESMYLSLLKQEERVPGTADFIDHFLHDDMPARAGKLAAAFRAAGVQVRAMPEAITREQRRAWGEAALMHLMKQDCSRADFDRMSGRYAVHGSAACATLKSELQLDRIEGKSIAAEGELAYDAAAAKCAAHDAVTLSGAGDVSVAVPCGKPLDARPPWFGVEH